MARAYNFSPGPAALPDSVMEQAQAAFCEFADWRTSVMEQSHRGARFMAIYEETEHLLRELLQINDDYAVLFLTGGATGQAAALPLNLTGDDGAAAYIISGHWSRRAAEEGRRFCRARVVADSADSGYKTLPEIPPAPASPEGADIPPDAAYVHIADNETVHGVEYPAAPKVRAPLVADMSSNIATRELRISDYGAIYAGAQKNLGIAGVTVVIIHKALPRPRRDIPLVWDYKRQWGAQSMLNTPPTFQIYMLGLVLKWLRGQGGVAAMARQSRQKAALLYDYLDSTDFYQPYVSCAACRSRINAPLFLAADELTAEFLAGAEERGLLGLRGHKALGGIRVSLYNSMMLAGVAALIDYMRAFEKARG